jgi:hypothetical protein
MSRQPSRGELDDPRVKVLYVGGYSRSGSTLLARVLGEPPGTVCVGETRFLWSRGLVDNVDCGCGAAFRSCAFWTEVGQEAFGGWDRVDAHRLSEVDRVTNLLSALPVYRAAWLRPSVGAMIDDYTAHLVQLYAAISRVSGAATIVEMSKHPTFACLLMRMPDTDVRILHLVRDSRAVAYSWTRRRHLSSPIDGKHFMPRFGAGETATKWLAWNLVFHALSTGRTPYMRLSYESFVADPRTALRQISAFADQSLFPVAGSLAGTQVKLSDHHIFSGNPMRSTTGWVPIRLDGEWQTALSSAQLAKVTAITWPLLGLYGYPLRAGYGGTAEAGNGRRRTG